MIDMDQEEGMSRSESEVDNSNSTSAPNKNIEMMFFKLVFLSHLTNMTPDHLNLVGCLCPKEMYILAKYTFGAKFNEYHHWIE